MRGAGRDEVRHYGRVGVQFVVQHGILELEEEVLDIDKAIVSVAKLAAGRCQMSLGAASVLRVPRKPTALEIELVISRPLMGFWAKEVMIIDVGTRVTGLQHARVCMPMEATEVGLVPGSSSTTVDVEHEEPLVLQAAAISCRICCRARDRQLLGS